MAFAVLVANLENNATKSHHNPFHYAHKTTPFSTQNAVILAFFMFQFLTLFSSNTSLCLQCVAYLSWPQNYAKILHLE